MTKICLPIVEKEIEDVLQKISEYTTKADIIEIWLGELFSDKVMRRDFSSENMDFCLQKLTEIRNATPLPLLATCKPPKEKGNFQGSEKERFEVLLQAAKIGFEYVDFDFEFSENLLKKFILEKPKDGKLILSAHYFDGTPGLPHLTQVVQKMQKNNPDLVKFAATPKNFKDVVTIIRLAEKLGSKNIPHITISMGELGKITRIASPLLGNKIMFAAPDEKSTTASGQVSAKKMKEFFGEFGAAQQITSKRKNKKHF